MGRYYSGDIEGKFWFGVQSSDDARHFGGIELEPNYITYSFEKSDLPTIKEGIKKCIDELGIYKTKIDAFFDNAKSYNDEKLAKAITKEDDKRLPNTNRLLEIYARLELGQKILKCVQEQEYCTFDAEL